MNEIDPAEIQEVSVFKGVRATDKYGEKGKDGVVEIITKNKITNIRDNNAIIQKGVKGIVLKEDVTPFPGVPILVAGTKTRTTTDASGNFVLSDVPENAFVVFSYRGYMTQVIKAEFLKDMSVKMQKDPDYKEPVSGPEPLIVIDDVISTKTMSEVSSSIGNQIAKFKSLSTKDATDKYGEKGKNGAVEIMTLKRAAELGIKVPFRRRNPEDYPTFQGERFTAFRNWVISNLKYPADAKIKRLEGWVQVNFIIQPDGTVSDAKYIGSSDPILGDAVVQVVKLSPKWEPAKNPEAKEPLESSVTLKFKMPDQILDEEPYVVVEEMPQYPGGDGELLRFISENTHYPDSAKAANIQGRVIVRFIVNTDGKTEDATVLKGVHPLLDAEAVRVVSLISGWTPGSQGGKPVPVWYMVPITFTLNPIINKGNQPTTISPDNAPQQKPETSALTEKTEPFVVVEEMPMYPGGDKELLNFIANNVKYPEETKAQKIEGRVIIRFAVTEEGKTELISVLKGVHPLLDAEAVRVVSLLTGWTPGYQGGKPVPVWYMVPVSFRLPLAPGQLFSKLSEDEVLFFLTRNTLYPEEARISSDTGRVFVVLKINKGGIIKECTAVSDISENKVPVMKEVVIVGYNTDKAQIASDSKKEIPNNHLALKNECTRVANRLVELNMPEWKDKDMEFALLFHFKLK